MDIKRRILEDMGVELADEFDLNFRRKGFFGRKWLPSKNGLIKTGALRRSIQHRVEGDGVRFTSGVAYAVAHNEGMHTTQTIRSHIRRVGGRRVTVRRHTRRVNLPERRFVGPGPETDAIIKGCIDRAVEAFAHDLKP